MMDSMLIAPEVFERMCAARERLCAPDDGERRAPSVRAVARGAGVSVFHFIRVFRALFGVTPHQARVRARLERARLALALGDGAVTEISLESGFDSLGTFSRVFAARVGESPTAHRRRIRAAMTEPGVLPAAMTPGCLGLMTEVHAEERNFGEARPPPPGAHSRP